MKKPLFILGIAAFLLIGCSNEEDLANAWTDENTEELFLEDLSSNAPIVFGSVSGNATTRGSVTSEGFAANDIGIFCLSRAVLKNGKTMSWSKTGDTIFNKLNVWQDNVSANIVPIDSSTSRVEWTHPMEDHFYPAPTAAWYAYDFYAYYPRTDSIVYHQQSVWAMIELDGTQDVIHAKATAAENDTEGVGYSYAYFKNNASAENPHFNFTHKLARLNFKIKLKDDLPDSAKVHVDSLVIENYLNRVYLVVASTNPTNIGSCEIPAYSHKGNFILREKDNSSISGKKDGSNYKYELSTTPISVGDCLMIPPLPKSDSSSKLNIKVFLKDKKGSIYTPTSPLALEAPADGWQSGKSYDINITLKDPIKVVSTAKSTDWEDSMTTLDLEEP